MKFKRELGIDDDDENNKEQTHRQLSLAHAVMSIELHVNSDVPILILCLTMFLEFEAKWMPNSIFQIAI